MIFIVVINSNHQLLILLLAGNEPVRDQVAALVQETAVQIGINFPQAPMPMLLLPMLLGVEQLGTALGIFDVGLRGYYHVDVPAGEPALQVLVHLLQEIDCLLPG